jgi:hypothetical protein
VTLSSTRLYDFCDPLERAHWLDILIALIEYLRSGESKVGFLNKLSGRNMLHKSQEDEGEVESDVGKTEDTTVDIVEGETPRGITVISERKEVEVAVGDVGTLKRSSRKRGLGNVERERRDTKVRRKT